MFGLVLVALSTISYIVYFLCPSARLTTNHQDMLDEKVEPNGSLSSFSQFWANIIEEYGFPFGQSCISLMYALYRSFTLLNASLFLLKYVPTGFYMYKLVKNIYITSQERIKQKQMELEDIQLQIQIVNTKLCVRDAEFTERAEQLQRGAERLRALRARVRDIIAADQELRRALDCAAPWGDEPSLQEHSTPEEEREYIIALLKELKQDQVAIPEEQTDKMNCGEHVPTDIIPSENSVYSSLSDVDAGKDCRVKIVKVTNVYKVAYLKHYIKQKRLRRATKQALLKKRIEKTKKLFEDWQKSLTMVVNTKLSMLDASPLDVASQEAMGDYSKPNVRELFDSDSDLRTNGTDTYYDEYSVSWPRNPYRSYHYNYEDVPDSAVGKEFYDSQESNFSKYHSHMTQLYECNDAREPNILLPLPEETSSKIAMQETKSEAEGEFEAEYRDLIAL